MAEKRFSKQLRIVKLQLMFVALCKWLINTVWFIYKCYLDAHFKVLSNVNTTSVTVVLQLWNKWFIKYLIVTSEITN